MSCTSEPSLQAHKSMKFKELHLAQVWWRTPIISTPKTQRPGFKANLGDVARPHKREGRDRGRGGVRVKMRTEKGNSCIHKTGDINSNTRHATAAPPFPRGTPMWGPGPGSIGGKQHLRDAPIETLTVEPSHLVKLDPEPLRDALAKK